MLPAFVLAPMAMLSIGAVERPPPGVLTTHIRCSREMVAGTPAAVRIIAQRSTSEDEHGPWPGANVAVWMEGKGRTAQLFEGAAGADGEAGASFLAPDWPEGEYSLVVRAAAGKRQHLRRVAVRLASQGKVLLQSDKPLYQPGQAVHLRAIAVRPRDMKPAAGMLVQFEVFDPRDNRVFTERRKTSEFGVAWADFQLGGEILLGAYKARAQAVDGSAPPAELELNVERYALPKFRVSLETDRSWYRLGERARVHLDARYFFGKPVSGAKVRAEVGLGRERTFAASQRLETTTDSQGRATLELEVPLGERSEPGLELVVNAEVTDPAGHTEKGARRVPTHDSGLKLELVSEAPELVAEVPNRLYVLAASPDGSPISGAEVSLKPTGEARTNAAGIAELELTPASNPGARHCLELEASVRHAGETRVIGRCVGVQRPARCATVTAQGPARTQCEPGPLLLRTDRALYPLGAPIGLQVLAPHASGTVLVDVVKDGQTVDTAAVEVRDGRGRLVLDPQQRRFGTLQFQPYWAGGGRVGRRGSPRLVFVERPSALQVEARAEGGRDGAFAPGEHGRLRLKVVDAASGQPARAALGLVMVDKALLALRPVRPAFARSYFLLAESATKHLEKLAVKPGNLASLIEQGAKDPLEDLVARVLLAGAAPPWDTGFEEDGLEKLLEEAAARRERVIEAVDRYSRGHQLGERVSSSRAAWRFRRGLLKQMVADGALPARDAADPWGRPYPIGEVTAHLGSFDDWAQSELDDRLSSIYQALAQEARAGRLPLEGDSAKRKVVRFAEADLRALAEAGKLAEAALVDPWDRPFRVKLEKRVRWISGVRSRFLVASSGPDQEPDTRDDRFPADASGQGLLAVMGVTGSAIGFGGLGSRGTGAGGGGAGYGSISLGGRGMSRVPGSAGLGHEVFGRQPARVRDSFPETMLWRPDVVTDESGEASVDVTVADSITTWLLSADAIAADGRLGQTSLEVRVFQEFFVDLDLPPALTQGDEVAVPVAVYNYLPRPQRVTLALEDAPWFERLGEAAQGLELSPHEVGVRHFRIRARGVGRHPLTVLARGSSAADAIRREAEVFPDGVERTASFQDRLRAGAIRRHALVIPPATIEGTPRAALKLYPGMSAHVMEGLDGMLRMPSGCFEQTSSTTYPNALILDYLRRTKKTTPEIEDRARRYLSAGYQKLLSYEVPGGGFSWFGDPPANQVLTAYGLEEFVDMAQLFPVDRRLITRTREWLERRQQEDGSWRVERSPINEGATDHYQEHAVRTTAYIGLALRKAGSSPATIDRAVQYVRKHLAPDADAYTLALAVQLLSGERLAERLWSQRQPAGTGAYFPAPRGQTLTYGAGKSGDVETTARAATALLPLPGTGDRVEKAIAYLVSSKDSLGNWHSTQATIRSLQALLDYERARGSRRKGALLVEVDGKQVGTLAVRGEGGAADLVQTLELPQLSAAGEHEVTLRFEGKGEVSYQLVSSFHEPRPEEAPAPGELLSVRTALDESMTRVGGEVEQTVVVRAGEAIAMPVVRAGIPPGFLVDEAALERLVLDKHIDKYERGAREVVFYLTKLPARQEVWLPLKLLARMPVKAQIPPATVYEYYRPERRAEGIPVGIEARL